jgi:hypothetical protein
MASLRWLSNVVGGYLVQVSLLLIGHQVGRFLQVSALASYRLTDCANFTPTPDENNQCSANYLVQCKQQVNPFLSMNNYTPHVISRHDKNRQLSLLSQRKTRINQQPEIHFLQYKIQTFLKMAPSSI